MLGDERPDGAELWQFAQAFYALPEIDRACLALQDEHGADVVLLIGLLWLAVHNHRSVDAADIAGLDAAMEGWRESAVRPLRDLRRSLKLRLADLPASAAEARSRIKAAELSAERVAVDLLAAALARLPEADNVGGRQYAAPRSVENYLVWLGAAPTPELRTLTAVILGGLSGMTADEPRTNVENRGR